MSTTRSTNLHQLHVSQLGLTNRVIADFPGKFPKDSSPVSSHLFNNISEDQKYDRIKYLSLIMTMIYISRLTWSDILLIMSHLPTKSQQPTNADYKNAR